MEETPKCTSESTTVPALRGQIPELAIGCVVLFSGLTSLELRIQKTLRNRWTRCAIIVQGPGKQAVMLQSTSRPIARDIITGQLRTGVQLVAIPEVLANFQGHISFRPVAPPLSLVQIGRLAGFAHEKMGLPFNFSSYYAVRAARRRNREGDETSYYCTELVAAALQHVGVLRIPPMGRSASNHVPGDFAAESENLLFNDGYSLRCGEIVSATPGL